MTERVFLVRPHIEQSYRSFSKPLKQFLARDRVRFTVGILGIGRELPNLPPLIVGIRP